MSAASPSQVAPPTSTPTTSPRTGRLRGLSYLRNYAHGHNHAPSQAAPTVVTAANVNCSNGGAASSSSIQQQSSISRSVSTPARARSTSPLNNTASNAWLPTVSGINALSRVASLPSAELSTSTGLVTANGSSNIRPVSNPTSAVRSIDEALSTPPEAGPPIHQPNNPPLVHSPGAARVAQPSDPIASIRFIPHVDSRASRESLIFAPIERALRFKDERIRVGRYSDRDQGNPSAPVGFKSKVVSRRHCEFWCDNGQWYVRDVKSSSGTFLNHIRLSPPGIESRAYPLYDGDILQLGIDFKGGEEQIFRCVKIRVELNRAWQKALNNFNMSAHRRIRNLAKNTPTGDSKGKDGDTCSTHTSECSICLMPVAPCQSLFVAPCSHVWHYKCIRPLVEKVYPTFLCPNCRAIADLDRDIDDDDFGEEIWEVLPDDIEQEAEGNGEDLPEPEHGTTGVASTDLPEGPTHNIQETEVTRSGGALPIEPPMGSSTALPEASRPEPETAAPSVEIPQNPSASGSRRRRGERVAVLDLRREQEVAESNETGSGSNSGGEGGHEGPMTPRNDAGPFVFDGGAFDSLDFSPPEQQDSNGHDSGQHHSEHDPEWREVPS